MQAPMCRDCFTGTLRSDVTPRGSEETAHGLPTYVAAPDPGVTPLGIVVIISDAFGWKLRNTRALADTYAKRVPCTLEARANPPPPTANQNLLTRLLSSALTTLSLLPLLLAIARLFLHNRRGLAYPRIQAFMAALRASSTSTPTTKIGVAGFCWGGLHAVLLTHDTPPNKVFVASADGGGGGGVGGGDVEYPLVDCAFTAHPSLLAFPADLEAVAQPLSVANGEDDQWMGRDKMARLVEILGGKNAELAEAPPVGGGGGETASEGRHEAVVYPGAKHGFAVRGDPEDPMQRERGEQSEEQAVRWFRRWLG
ncbi:hypothetical protein N658DRAFT_569648 [Parathielavia hyrcaniae]|uniref:Dienelactone hydrolase domain-containing protein n=1 Tax=Parathielavia hyrcaniae TaxID=113614 RepID=A0AAN6PRY7_9PEZI|nr:hypothetical protein N658DRAFT_569648 [Parathielavia hyrcaniae]